MEETFMQVLSSFGTFLSAEHKHSGKVLVIEDDEDLGRDLKELLEADGFSCALAHNAAVGQRVALIANPDVIVLDRLLPDSDGLDICRELREAKSDAKVLMLTGLCDVDSVVDGLNSGADDYLGKPFDFQELIARVKVLMARPKRYGTNCLRYAHLTIDTLSNEVTVAGVPVELYPVDRALLEFLIRRPEKLISADEIINAVWRADEAVSSDSVRASIMRLRKLTRCENYPQVIQNRYGSGYMLSVFES